MTFNVDAFIVAAFSVGGICFFISLCALIFLIVYFKPYKKCYGCCCSDKKQLLEGVSENAEHDWMDMPSTHSSFEIRSIGTIHFNGIKDLEPLPNNKLPPYPENLYDYTTGLRPQNPYVHSFDVKSGLDVPKDSNTKERKFVNEAFKFLDEF